MTNKPRRLSVGLRRSLYTAVLPLGVFCTATTSWADNCTGYDALVAQSAETTDLGQGLKLTSFKSQSILISNDSVYNLVTGECSGITLQTADGKTQSSGYCARRDKNGDTQSIAFRQLPGTDKGEWKSTGGTGKFAGKQDSGWYQMVRADGKMVVTKWGGDCH
jgi:hypothetical protein